MPTDLSRRYLKAMGIESWQHRQSRPLDARPLAETAVASERLAVAQSAVAIETSETASTAQTPANQRAAVTAPSTIAACRADNLDTLLANAPVNLTATGEQRGQGSLLLVLEQALSDAGAELLTAMLKAINIDRATLPVATMIRTTDANEAASANAEPLTAVCERFRPAVVVVMAGLDDSARLNDLDTHRAAPHRFGWLNAQVVVTLHPQVLLDNPNGKRPAWEDLKRVKALLDAN